MDTHNLEEEERIRRRRVMIARRKKEKRKRERRLKIIRTALFFGVPALLLIGVIILVVNIVSHNVKAKKQANAEPSAIVNEDGTVSYSEESGWYEDEFGNIYDDKGGHYDVNGNYYDAEGNVTQAVGRPHPDEAKIDNTFAHEHPFANTNKPDEEGMMQVGDVKMKAGYTAQTTASTISPPEEISQSTYSILIDETTGDIVAARNAYDRMYPASMTKIMTLLVAVENITDLDDVVYVSQEAADWSYRNDGSAVNWSVGEKLTVRDLLYGTILSSGADAVYDLAVYVAGDQDTFVQMMNDRVATLGLSETTHFTNAAGFYDDNHYTTPYDMAMIIKAAVENDLCREVMSAHTYNTPITEEHPEGILISNWFLRRIEDKDSGGLVLCAKTGFVSQSGNCAASYMISNSGKPYVCVTGHAHSAWRAIYDHVGLYYNYTN